MDNISVIFQALGAAFAGGAAASGWTVAVIVANVAFDGLDYNRADRQLRRVLLVSANFQAILLGVGAVFCLLSGSIASFVVSLLCALGFLSNVWTLAPRGRKPKVTGVRENRKGKRVLAVALTLMLTMMAGIAAVMAAIGV